MLRNLYQSLLQLNGDPDTNSVFFLHSAYLAF
jgi:hypothetical protein